MDGVNLDSTISAVASGAQTLVRYMPEPFSQGVQFAESLARATLGSGGIGDNPQAIIDQQIELQQEMLQITLITNLERTRHETKMAPVRNIRLS